MVSFLNYNSNPKLTDLQKIVWFGKYIAIDFKQNLPIWDDNGVSNEKYLLMKKMHPLSLGVDFYIIKVK